MILCWLKSCTGTIRWVPDTVPATARLMLPVKAHRLRMECRYVLIRSALWSHSSAAGRARSEITGCCSRSCGAPGAWCGLAGGWARSWPGDFRGLLKCPARLAESRLVRPAQALWVPGCQLRSGGRCAVDQSEGL